jgi:uncharacterized protein (TIGR03435 family)
LAGYRLVVAAGGAKLKKSAGAQVPAKTGGAGPESSPAPSVVAKGGIPQFSDNAPSGTLFTLAGAVLRGRHESMDGLAGWLMGELGAPVINATGLEGEYDYDVPFKPEPRPLPRGSRIVAGGSFSGGAAAPEPISPESPDANPTLPFALQGQLGLKLDAVKSVPVEVVVLDKANRDPTEN